VLMTMIDPHARDIGAACCTRASRR
jgi:hypothetical protein